STLHCATSVGLNPPTETRRPHIDADRILLILGFQTFDAYDLRIDRRSHELREAAGRQRTAQVGFHWRYRLKAGLNPSAPLSHRTSGRSASYSRARNDANDGL